jgi:hypothetical protein
MKEICTTLVVIIAIPIFIVMAVGAFKLFFGEDW